MISLIMQQLYWRYDLFTNKLLNMAILFHQNMRVFGGGSAPRNAVFNARFAQINAITGANYGVAGFTEITNWNRALVQLPLLAASLDAGLTDITIVKVGMSALGTAEYLGIIWDPNFLTALFAGQVLKHPVTRAWTVYRTPAAGGIIPGQINTPGAVNFTADSRGPAFVAGTVGGNARIYIFFHNMYATGDRSSAFSSLPVMVDRIRAALGAAYANASAFIGGDFNVLPRRPTNTRNAADQFPLVVAAQSVGGYYTHTTNSNAYDFWLCTNNAFDDPDAAVYTNTRVALASDHAAIALTV
jgi:hypothetical protein